jgi:hypothetical protein
MESCKGVFGSGLWPFAADVKAEVVNPRVSVVNTLVRHSFLHDVV